MTAKEALLFLVAETPADAPTPASLTDRILSTARQLESGCPTADADVLSKLPGTWELLWTAQDKSTDESRLKFINPLENQSYSNNPGGTDRGRANPVLPRPIQDRLEEAGIVSPTVFSKSTQSIDPKSKLVKNVVAFGLGGGKKEDNDDKNTKRKKQKPASLTVTVAYDPDPTDPRRINVKFQSCLVNIPNTPINFNIPLGIFGPTGWLRTVYIDDKIRVTRGHKGSVFILRKPGARSLP